MHLLIMYEIGYYIFGILRRRRRDYILTVARDEIYIKYEKYVMKSEVDNGKSY